MTLIADVPGPPTTAPFDLTGSIAVVTGARRGIGLAIAEALAHAGADIIGVSASMEPAGGEAERRVTAAGRSFTALQVDFADRAAVIDLAGRLADANPNQQPVPQRIATYTDQVNSPRWAVKNRSGQAPAAAAPARFAGRGRGRTRPTGVALDILRTRHRQRQP